MKWALLLAAATAPALAVLAPSLSRDAPSSKVSEVFFETSPTMDEAATEAICRRAAAATPPRSDSPSADEAKALTGCDGEALYYGIGATADPVRARKCALSTINDDDQQPYHLHDREGLLMMIYANGRGARRNFETALHYACQIDDSAAARDSRARDLDHRGRWGWRGQDFESCEHATSGLAGAYCAGHSARLAEQDRDRNIGLLAARWSPEARHRFAQLKKSAENYFSTAHEMDCFRGTLQTACAINGAEAEWEKLVAVIDRLQRGQATRLEAEANRERRKASLLTAETAKEDMSWMPNEDKAWYDSNAEESRDQRVTFERDLVAFTRAAFPAVTSHSIRRIFANQ